MTTNKTLVTPVVRNVVFSAAGKVTLAVVSIVGSILYFRILGASRYAAIGWYLLGYSVLSIIEPPFNAAIIRQLSRSAGSLLRIWQIQAIREMEKKYLGSVLTASAVLSGVVWATRVLHVLLVDFSREGGNVTVLSAMIVALAVQWCLSFYNGCLLGLQHHGTLQIFTVLFAILRLVASFAALSFFTEQLLAFFICQMLVSIIQLGATRKWVYREMKQAVNARTYCTHSDVSPSSSSNDLLHVSIVSVTLLVYNQWDKLLVGAVFSSSAFGVYSLIWQIIGGLYAAYSPICNVFFPLLTAGIKYGDQVQAKRRYQQAAQVMAVAVVPPTLVISLYAKDVLWLMTSDHNVADSYWGVLAALMPSAMFSAFLFVPWAAQLATAQTGKAIKRFFVTLLLLVAGQTAAAHAGSLLLVAISYTVVTVGQTFWIARITHRDILPGTERDWRRYAIVKPLLVGILVATSLRVISAFIPADTVLVAAVQLGCAVLVTTLAVALQVPATRALAKQWRSALASGKECASA